MVIILVSDKRTKEGYSLRIFKTESDLLSYTHAKKIKSFLVKRKEEPVKLYNEVEPHHWTIVIANIDRQVIQFLNLIIRKEIFKND